MPGQPYVAKLPDGRYFAVELPEGSAETDPLTGEVILQPRAIHLLDRLRTLLTALPQKATHNRLKILREILDLSPESLAEKVQVDPDTVLAWEEGKAKPNADQIAALEAMRQQAARSGVLFPVRGLAS